jgi:hypothetical protein
MTWAPSGRRPSPAGGVDLPCTWKTERRMSAFCRVLGRNGLESMGRAIPVFKYLHKKKLWGWGRLIGFSYEHVRGKK